MDINWIRTLFTLLVFFSFLLVLYIVYNKRNRKSYDDAANSIFDNDKSEEDGR